MRLQNKYKLYIWDMLARRDDNGSSLLRLDGFGHKKVMTVCEYLSVADGVVLACAIHFNNTSSESMPPRDKILTHGPNRYQVLHFA